MRPIDELARWAGGHLYRVRPDGGREVHRADCPCWRGPELARETGDEFVSAVLGIETAQPRRRRWAWR